MQIHTFEVSSILSNEKFYGIQKELTTKDKSKWKSEKNGMTYFGLSDKGVLIKMYQIKKKGYYSYSITYRISARRVMENDNYVGLFNTKEYFELEEKVNQLLNKKTELLPCLDKCNLRRMDFCVNAKMKNQEQVKAYINIARRCGIPAKMKRYKINDKPTKDEMTVYTDNYAAVSIYNKYKQMKKEEKEKNKKIYSNKDFEKAENIVRIEIRCMEGKIKALKEKYHISSINEFMIHANEIGNDIFNYYLTKMFGFGEIHTLSESRNIIERSDYKEENRVLLKQFLEDASELRSVAKAIKLYTDNYGKQEIKKIIYMLDNINVNYVTATTRDVKLFDEKYIPTPIELFEDYMK